MQSIKDFFIKLEYSYGDSESDIKPCSLLLSENYDLSQKLKGQVYVYDCNNSSKTSFYLFTIQLEENELYEVRRFIWNQNKYDLYFTTSKTKQNEFEYTLFYAQSDPKTLIEIDSFKGNKEDQDKLEKIKKWKFESGAFWYDYVQCHNKIKKSKKVDRELIRTLIRLREELINVYENYQNTNEIVQALIDRTLFIKFLEDNHIINSDFYQHFFNDKNLEYKLLLNNPERKNDINKLFKRINSIFKNFLFKTPKIKNEDLKDGALSAIYHYIRGTREDGQLTLFDFRFDVIPVEFIGHIYEVFLEKKQRKEGIYYTPKKLAQLIVDNTIKQKGTVLDPSCGSGMFLVLAFRKLLKEFSQEPEGIKQKIEFRNKLIKDYIFGIEKQADARRLAVFSLFLELLQGLDSEELREFINEELQTEKEFCLFNHDFDFTENIIEANSLETQKGKIPHENLSFDFIIGNPPFAGIDESNKIETEFLNEHILKVQDPETNKTVEYKSGDLVGDKQISQCFMLRIKDWAKPETRFGFVMNSSNFYNEQADKFQSFFYKHYQIEKFYELSEVKEILFHKPKESVCTVIFYNNLINNNTFEYQPVYLEKFSETFDLLIIHKDKAIIIQQRELIERKGHLRKYLIGNEYDRELLELLSKNSKLNNYVLNNKDGIAVGIRITGSDKISDNDKNYNTLTDIEKKEHFKKIKSSFIRKVKTEQYSIPYIEYKDISAYKLLIDKYVSEEDIRDKRYRRNKDISFFKGEKILLRKIPIKKTVYLNEAVYYNKILCFPDGVFCIRLNDNKYYRFITAILNSNLANYYINHLFLKRIRGSFTHIGKSTIRKIPIPNLNFEELTEIDNLINKIQNIDEKSKILLDKINNYIFDLYNLNILEKIRIVDFFAPKRDIEEQEMEAYKENLLQTIKIYCRKTPVIKHYFGENLPFQMMITVMFFNGSEAQMPSGKQALQYIINELMEYGANFIEMKEKIFGNDCVYIIKDNNYKNWTLTKAFEDGQEIIKKLRS